MYFTADEEADYKDDFFYWLASEALNEYPEIPEKGSFELINHSINYNSKAEYVKLVKEAESYFSDFVFEDWLIELAGLERMYEKLSDYDISV